MICNLSLDTFLEPIPDVIPRYSENPGSLGYISICLIDCLPDQAQNFLFQIKSGRWKREGSIEPIVRNCIARIFFVLKVQS